MPQSIKFNLKLLGFTSGLCYEAKGCDVNTCVPGIFVTICSFLPIAGLSASWLRLIKLTLNAQRTWKRPPARSAPHSRFSERLTVVKLIAVSNTGGLSLLRGYFGCSLYTQFNSFRMLFNTPHPSKTEKVPLHLGGSFSFRPTEVNRG